MQIFHGSLKLLTKPVDDGTSTICEAEVPTTRENEVATPVRIKAYGKTGARLETLAPGSRIQVVNGSLHRGDNYSYVIKIYHFHVLPSDQSIPDWQCVILAGRATRDVNTNDRREVVNTGEFLSVTRAIAVNRSKTEADFFDVNALGSSSDKVNRAQQLLDYFAQKGDYIMAEGRLVSTQGQTKDGAKRVFTKVRAERLHFGPRSSIAKGPHQQSASPEAQVQEPVMAYSGVPAAQAQYPVTGQAQPAVTPMAPVIPQENELPF